MDRPNQHLDLCPSPVAVEGSLLTEQAHPPRAMDCGRPMSLASGKGSLHIDFVRGQVLHLLNPRVVPLRARITQSICNSMVKGRSSGPVAGSHGKGRRTEQFNRTANWWSGSTASDVGPGLERTRGATSV